MRDDTRIGWARVLGVLACMTASFVVAAILGLGFFFAVADFSAIACFDGTEPGCDNPPADTGISAIRASSWTIAAASATALAAAWRLSLRLTRTRHLLFVLALCGTATDAVWHLATRT